MAGPFGHGAWTGGAGVSEGDRPDVALVGGTVQVRGLRVRGRHGVLESERRDGQEFVVDVDLLLGAALEDAARSDDLADAVDYAELSSRLAAVVAGEPVALLERLAALLAEECLRDRRVRTAEVRVAKPSAPVEVEVAEVAVVVIAERVRDEQLRVDLEDPGWRLLEEDDEEYEWRPAPRVAEPGDGTEDRALRLRAGVRAVDEGREPSQPSWVITWGDQEAAHVPARALASDSPVVVALGSDLGDRVEHLRAGVRALQASAGWVVAVSSLWESPFVVPDGARAGSRPGDVLNAVVLLAGTNAFGVLATGIVAEAALGRPLPGAPGRRPGEPSARALDVDVVAHGDEEPWSATVSAGPLSVPHPRAHERAFVLLPWLEVQPDAVLPGHGRVADLATEVDVSDLRRRDDLAGWADDLLEAVRPQEGSPS